MKIAPRLGQQVADPGLVEIENLGDLGMAELLHDREQQDAPLERRQRGQTLLDPFAEIDRLQRRHLGDRGLHHPPRGMERAEQLHLQIAVRQMVRFGDHHLETDPDALVADLLRAGKKPGMAPEIRNVLQNRFANVGHRSVP